MFYRGYSIGAYRVLALSSFRRLWEMRQDPEAKRNARLWLQDLRRIKTIEGF